MSLSVLDVYNAAISVARGKGRLNSLTQASVEREECDIWYPLIRDQVQESAYWPGCRSTAQLTLLEEAGESWVLGGPEEGFQYSYGLPTNCLRPWFLADYQRFMLSFDATRNRMVLNTNAQSPLLIYSVLQANPAHWTPGQRLATVHALGAAITGKLTGQSGLAQQNYQLANMQILSARSDAMNSINYQIDTLPPELQVRSYADAASPTRYFYPYGAMFNAD